MHLLRITHIFLLYLHALGSMCGIITRVVRKTVYPPCFINGEQCSTTINKPTSNQDLAIYLGSIVQKIVGARITGGTIKSNISKRWPIVLALRGVIPIESVNRIKDIFDVAYPVNMCSKMHIIYTLLNEIANYIENLLNNKNGAINSDVEVNMKMDFLRWQEDIYRCMCEIKYLLRTLNCDACIEVPSGVISEYFQSCSESTYRSVQQMATYWVVSKSIHDLDSIHYYLKYAINEIRENFNDQVF